jgi:hypothetical protein
VEIVGYLILTRGTASPLIKTRPQKVNNPRKPNIVVKWLMPLLCVQEILGSNLGPKTGYPD